LTYSFELRDRVEHRGDILRRNVGHDVVDLLKNETAARRPDSETIKHVFYDRLGTRGREHRLRIATASPEAKPVSEVGFETARRHAGAGRLYWIDRVQPGFYQIVKQLPHASTTVQLDFDRRQLLGSVPHPSVTRLEEATVHGG
jgi:hypothetical protein